MVGQVAGPLMLNVAEGELWTDGGRTRVTHKTQRSRSDEVATEKRPVGNSEYDETIDGDGIRDVNAMKTNHCHYNGDNEHGYMCAC